MFFILHVLWFYKTYTRQIYGIYKDTLIVCFKEVLILSL